MYYPITTSRRLYWKRQDVHDGMSKLPSYHNYSDGINQWPWMEQRPQ